MSAQKRLPTKVSYLACFDRTAFLQWILGCAEAKVSKWWCCISHTEILVNPYRESSALIFCITQVDLRRLRSDVASVSWSNGCSKPEKGGKKSSKVLHGEQSDTNLGSVHGASIELGRRVAF